MSGAGTTDTRELTSTEEGLPQNGESDRTHARIVWALVTILLLAVYIRPIGSSLWLDELGTWWVAKDGVRDVLSRSWEIQGQSPFYYLVAWVTREFAGSHEWALRLPSLIFAICTMVIVCRLAVRMVDVECGRLSVLMLVAMPAFAFAAVDFRPYALATLLATATAYACVVWLDEGRTRWGVAFVLLGAATLYAHYLFGLVLLSLASFIIWRLRRGRTMVSALQVVFAFLAIGMLCAPLAVQVVALWQRRQEWTQGDSFSVDWLSSVLLPSVFIVGASLGLLLAVTQNRLEVRSPRVGSSFIPLCVFWVVIPLVVLAIITLTTNADVAISRYALVSAPAIALLLGAALRSIGPPSARRIIAIGLAIVVVGAMARGHHAGDWRGSMGTVRAVETPRSLVIVEPGFTESNQSSWLADPERRSFLSAPLSLYTTDGNVVLLPLDLDPALSVQVREEILAQLPDASNVILVNGGNMDGWIHEVIGPHQWREQQLPTADQPYVKMFTRVANQRVST